MAVQAEQIATAAGDMPGWYKGLVEAAKKPRIRWEAILRRFVSKLQPVNQSFFPPHRRHLWRGMYLPRTQRKHKPTLVIAIDSSASVSNQLLEVFFGELNAILAELPMKIVLLTCDTRVHHVGTYSRGPLKEVEVHGRGGTFFHPVFEWVEENHIRPDGLIYMTDGEATWPDKQPSYKTLWLISTTIKPKWGEHIELPRV